MKDIVKTAIVLSLIAIIAGLLLGGVNQLTYLTPDEKLQRNLTKAYDKFDGGYSVADTTAVSAPSGAAATLKAAYRSKTAEGAEDAKIYIYNTTVKGYANGLELMIVIKDNKIVNVAKIASGETIAKPFSDANLGKYYAIEDVTAISGIYTNKQTAIEGGTQITVVTGATLSSNGICNSVNLAIYYHQALVGGGL